MCTICGAAGPRNETAERMMLLDTFQWQDRSWYAVTLIMPVDEMYGFLRNEYFKYSSETAREMSTGGTFSVWRATGDVTYTVVCSASEARLYRDELP